MILLVILLEILVLKSQMNILTGELSLLFKIIQRNSNNIHVFYNDCYQYV